MKACLGLHDFSVVNNRLLWLLALKEHFSDFKVTLFTVATDEKRDWGPSTIRGQFLEVLKKHLDWVQIVPHGLTHTKEGVRNHDHGQFVRYLKKVEETFEKDGLPFEKGFCAPHWRWNDNVTKALDDLGWWGAVDRRQPNMAIPKKFYRYNYCIDEPFWEAEMDLKLHGHIYGTENDLGLCFDNLLKLHPETEWCFVTDFLEDKDAS